MSLWRCDVRAIDWLRVHSIALRGLASSALASDITLVLEKHTSNIFSQLLIKLEVYGDLICCCCNQVPATWCHLPKVWGTGTLTSRFNDLQILIYLPQDSLYMTSCESRPVHTSLMALPPYAISHARHTLCFFVTTGFRLQNFCSVAWKKLFSGDKVSKKCMWTILFNILMHVY